MSIEVDHDWWKTMFDEVYLVTDARSVCDEELTRREVDVICEFLPIQPGDRILDLCGGHGRHSFELCTRGFADCTLLDYSRSLTELAISEADRRNYGIDIIRSDARDTGLPSESFDHVIIMGNSLGYINEPAADFKIIEEAYRLLRNGGWLLVDVTDGAAVKKSLNPNAWHEIGDDVVVCRQRELVGNKIHAREMVLSKQQGIIRDRTYAVRLYDSHTLAALLSQTQLKGVGVHTDFSPHRSKGDYGCMNRRIIATGRKI
ncbi:MAG: class I SAM-dependent methyltransferase [Deltaproteobacteria bacterium]|nr:class I SAM-dependent methyltransferase [Deltaproteobacteria bacterium]